MRTLTARPNVHPPRTAPPRAARPSSSPATPPPPLPPPGERPASSVPHTLFDSMAHLDTFMGGGILSLPLVGASPVVDPRVVGRLRSARARQRGGGGVHRERTPASARCPRRLPIKLHTAERSMLELASPPRSARAAAH